MKIYKKTISEFILLVLEKAVDGYVRIDDFINNPARYAFGDPSGLKKSGLSQALKKLRERGLIEQDQIQNETIIRLTELGRDALGPAYDQSSWDGKWRIVIFDIPEKQKRVRNLFRRRLKDWGFKIWQKSVWVSKRNVTAKLNILIKDLKIDKWVSIVESESTILHNFLNDRSTK